MLIWLAVAGALARGSSSVLNDNLVPRNVFVVLTALRRGCDQIRTSILVPYFRNLRRRRILPALSELPMGATELGIAAGAAIAGGRSHAKRWRWCANYISAQGFARRRTSPFATCSFYAGYSPYSSDKSFRLAFARPHPFAFMGPATSQILKISDEI